MTAPQVVSISGASRELFRAHLLRLDDQLRRDRFGIISLEEGFFEQYVQKVNFDNTLVLGVSCDGVVRASAELRSLTSNWAAKAEFAMIVERDWQGLALCMVLFRNAVSRAHELGVTELFIHCNLDKERSVSFLRRLGKELRSTRPLRLTALDLYPLCYEKSRAHDGLIRLGLVS